MFADLHNHTSLCKHANGTMEEYILKAIDEKIEIFGFSDHGPMEFDKKYRMSFGKMKEYESETNRLKSKYKNEIEILLAYEVDYLPGFIDDRVLKAKVDYLIGSVHFLNKWGFDNPEFIGEYKNKDIDKIYEEYFEAIEKMANLGAFQIVGHIDLIKVFNYKPKKDVKIIAQDALKAIKKANLAIEINSAGFRKPVKEQYPSKELLESAFEMGIDITFGSDAHEVNQIGFKKNEIIALAKEVGYSKALYFKNRDRVYYNL
jgi:histidinol-phosphatase (PHP family)